MSGNQVYQLCMALIPTVSILGSAVALWIRSRSTDRKLDENTALTSQAKRAAASAADKADTAAGKASAAVARVEEAQQSNAEKLQILHTIEKQTNGSMDALRNLVATLAGRVEKLEDYNRDAAHRVLEAMNAVHLEVAKLSALTQGVKVLEVSRPPTSEG